MLKILKNMIFSEPFDTDKEVSKIFNRLSEKYKKREPFNSDDTRLAVRYLYLASSGVRQIDSRGKAIVNYSSDLAIEILVHSGKIIKGSLKASSGDIIVDELQKIDYKLPFHFFDKAILKNIILAIYNDKDISAVSLKKLYNKPLKNHPRYEYVKI